jgi:membrane-associated phospholipid phosphatase
LNNTGKKNDGAVAVRLRSQLALKLFLLVVLNLSVYAPYIYLQHHQFFPVTTIPSTALDRMIPFWDQSVWVYLSIYLLMPIGPFLMSDRKQLSSYASGIILISVIANTIFIFWPTFCPRPSVEGATVAYKLLTAVDRPLHAIPSLHAAFAVYSALCGVLVIRDLGGQAMWRIALWIWAILILYATLATKQHMVADIVAGSALGVGAFLCVLGDRASILRMSLLVQSAFSSVNKPNSAKP